jgi:predicted nucleic acid-binding protein
MSFLLDTNVVSEARRPRGNTYVKAWVASMPSKSLYLSVLVIGEIRRGIDQLYRSDPAQAAVYEAWLVGLCIEYADRIIPVTAEIAEEWGRLNVPTTIPTVDGLMAATAKVHGLTFVTRNTSDVARTGVRLLNPFEPIY